VDTKTKIIRDWTTLRQKIQSLRRRGKSVAFTNGCFDLLHEGHVSYLEAAKKNDRVLIVGLNTDASVKRLKGHQRPIVPQEGRARVLAALECIDFVTFFNEDTPLKLIQAIRPDILVKGADWKGKEVVGSDIVKFLGGRVELIQYIPGKSTTNIVGHILKRAKVK
jgi:D-beta-D-heptose 7-phosphate kinase/D-beta-D-heptose 1-phosphate adenosyltransferase